MRRISWLVALAWPLVVGWSLPMGWKLKKADKLYREGEHEEAVAAYKDAHLERPDDPVLSYNLGTAQHKAEDYEGALASLAGATSTSDTTLLAKSLYNLGNTQYRLGRWREAAEAYTQSLQLDPDDVDAKHNLELVLRKMQ